ncbi:hypothetical protein MLD38_024002 [Melastoma candidum]|uniref:Uncharacterized protein n=1 Tax=Melastoma candidum TaxID=119954 RepID=A0ACB9NQS2_9MYRT|nr:hypothetical protein MLD38_024002 [Melastoma candidum]
MMVAWDTPAASSLPLLDDVIVGKEAFNRFAPAIPLVVNVIISENLYELLSASTGGRLQFSVYEKYPLALEMKHSSSSGNGDFPPFSSFIIVSRWLGCAAAFISFLIAAFIAFARFGNKGKVVLQIKVVSPPKSCMEQLLAIHEEIALIEGFIQDGNIVLLKLRALL